MKYSDIFTLKEGEKLKVIKTGEIVKLKTLSSAHYKKTVEIGVEYDNGGYGLLSSEELDKITLSHSTMLQRDRVDEIAVEEYNKCRDKNDFQRREDILECVKLACQRVYIENEKIKQIQKIKTEKEILGELAKETGLIEYLKKKEKKYYSCSPRFDKNKELVWWFNPLFEDIHRFGSFTTQELMDWANEVDGNKIDMTKEETLKNIERFGKV